MFVFTMWDHKSPSHREHCGSFTHQVQLGSGGGRGRARRYAGGAGEGPGGAAGGPGGREGGPVKAGTETWAVGRAGRIRSKESPILVVPGLVSAGQPGGYREFLFPARSSDHCVVWGDKGVDYCFVKLRKTLSICVVYNNLATPHPPL